MNGEELLQSTVEHVKINAKHERDNSACDDMCEDMKTDRVSKGEREIEIERESSRREENVFINFVDKTQKLIGLDA